MLSSLFFIVLFIQPLVTIYYNIMLLFFRCLKTTCPLAPSINSLPVMPSIVMRMPAFILLFCNLTQSFLLRPTQHAATVEYQGPWVHYGYNYDAYQGGGGRGVLEGGSTVYAGSEKGTCTGFYVSTSNPNQKYAVCSSHVYVHSHTVRWACGTVGSVAIDARKPCGGKVYLDAAAALVNQGVPTSFNIICLGGALKGFKKPAIGMGIHQVGITSGRIDSKVTMINYSGKKVVTV
jgi:hypothetical protein